MFIHKLDPLTAKFALAHTTRNGGVSVEMGEPTWQGVDIAPPHRPLAQESGGSTAVVFSASGEAVVFEAHISYVRRTD